MTLTVSEQSERRARVMDLRSRGLSNAQIGLRYGVSKSTISDWINDPHGERERVRKTGCLDTIPHKRGETVPPMPTYILLHLRDGAWVEIGQAAGQNHATALNAALAESNGMMPPQGEYVLVPARFWQPFSLKATQRIVYEIVDPVVVDANVEVFVTILNRQRRLVEAGRIRLGERVATSGGRTRPGRLDKWRLTSRDEKKIQAAATVYGGEPRPWADRPGEFELYTDTGELDVYLIPGSLTQHYELWGKAGDGPVRCLRRCDGYQEDLSDGPCLCDPATRYTEAQAGKACKPTSRLSVILPGVPGIGSWLLVTRGEHAADELAGMTDLLAEVSRRGEVVPCRLRIDQRRSVSGDGQTQLYSVPVLDLDVTPAQVLAITGSGDAAGEPPTAGAVGDSGTAAAPALAPGGDEGYVPAPARGDLPTVAQGVDSAAQGTSRRQGSQAPLGAAAPLPPPGAITPAEDQADAPGPAPRAGSEPQPAPPPPADAAAAARAAGPPDDTRPKITAPQRKMLFAKASEHGLDKADVRTAVERVTGQSSTAPIAQDDLDTVLVELANISAERNRQQAMG